MIRLVEKENAEIRRRKSGGLPDDADVGAYDDEEEEEEEDAPKASKVRARVCVRHCMRRRACYDGVAVQKRKRPDTSKKSRK